MLPVPQGHGEGFASPDLSSARGGGAGIQEVFLIRPSSVLKAVTLANVKCAQELNSVPDSVKSSSVKMNTARPHSPVLTYVAPLSFCPSSQAVLTDFLN